MSAKKLKWEVVLECDDEEENPTCWVAEINHEKHGKYVWISATYCDGVVVQYDVEVAQYYGETLSEMKVLATCKSLISAKRWVATNLI